MSASTGENVHCGVAATLGGLFASVGDEFHIDYANRIIMPIIVSALSAIVVWGLRRLLDRIFPSTKAT
jgi:hypothetical protein